MHQTIIGRRHLLRGMGAAIALPLLESMGCRSPGSGEVPRLRESRNALGAARRLVVIMVPNGRGHADDFYPTGTGTSFTLGPMMKPLEPHKKDLLLFRGIDNIACEKGPTDGHHEGETSLLTGWRVSGDEPTTDPKGMSVDYKIVKDTGIDVKRPILNLSPESNYESLTFDEYGQYQPAEFIPSDLFQKLFADASLTSEQFAQQLARRMSILDGVKSDYDALAKRVSGDDKKRIDAHLASIRDVEKHISIATQCDPGSLVIEDGDFHDHVPERVRSLMDLGLLALSCDISRLLTFKYRHAGGGESYYTWLGLPTDLAHEIHEMSHDAQTFRSELRAIQTWWMEQLAYFVQRMKEIPDGAEGGTLFDSTLILHSSEISEGGLHSHVDMPFFFVGSGGGHFKTGRVAEFDHRPHNDLLVSILQAFGVDTDTFGDPTCCNGPLPGLT